VAIGDKLFVADKPTLDAVKVLIGDANPASGDLLTLFKGLKLIADYVDTLETKVGTNTDGAGTGSIFARLAQIAGYVDSVEGYVDTLETNLGTTAQAASSSGTALQRLAYIIANYPQKPRTATKAGLTTTSSSYVDLVNVSGEGSLTYFVITTGETSVDNVGAIITIDGSTFMTYGPNSMIQGTSRWLNLAGDMGSSSPGGSMLFEFKTSLRIQIKADGTNSLTGNAVYNLR